MQQISWELILISLVHLCFICWELRFNSCWQGPTSSRYRIILLSALGLSHTLGFCINVTLRGALSVLPREISHQPMWEPGFILSSLRWKILEKIHTLQKSQPNWVPVATTEIWKRTLVLTFPLLLSHSPCSFVLNPWNHLLNTCPAAKSLSPPLCFKWKPNEVYNLHSFFF